MRAKAKAKARRRPRSGRWKWPAAATVTGVLAALAYAQWPACELPAGARADKVLVNKGERKLILLRDGMPFREYSVSLGGDPLGHKVQEGDNRTPEGLYRIDYRKADSVAYRALHVSYPDAEDIRRAKSRGVEPGGFIMIHGMMNGYGLIGRWHRLVDWTNGCIAVTNAEIDQLWTAVPDGTPIEIRP